MQELEDEHFLDTAERDKRNRKTWWKQTKQNQEFMILLKQRVKLGMWWFDPGWRSGTHLSCSITPLSAGQGGENRKKGSWVKTGYCPAQNRCDLGKLLDFITNQNLSCIMRSRTNLKSSFSPQPTLLPRLNITHDSLSFPCQWQWETGNKD